MYGLYQRSAHHHHQENQENDNDDGKKNKLVIPFFWCMTPDHIQLFCSGNKIELNKSLYVAWVEALKLGLNPNRTN